MRAWREKRKEEKFPSLIGRSLALHVFSVRVRSSLFPSLIGRSLAGALSLFFSLFQRVSIPHRKIAGALSECGVRWCGRVSIPHRKIAGILLCKRQGPAYLFPSLIGRSLATTSAAGLMSSAEFPSLIGRSLAAIAGYALGRPHCFHPS